VKIRDPNSDREWIGPDSFVKAMSQPCRRVVRINAPQMVALYPQNKSNW
jgi:hypothetical protein